MTKKNVLPLAGFLIGIALAVYGVPRVGLVLLMAYVVMASSFALLVQELWRC
ncbi:MAG: hypothetical protein H6665_14530 [Ardenticatenaceae bacterium]|nr:hypothetical protein [Ardenticatenaceae bacterium]